MEEVAVHNIHPCSGTRPSSNTRTKASRVEPPPIEFGEALVSTRSGALLARLGRRAFPPRGPLVGVDLSRPDLGGKAVRDPIRSRAEKTRCGAARLGSLLGSCPPASGITGPSYLLNPVKG
jgi:hypothetical protein